MAILPCRPDRARAFASKVIVLRGNKVIFNNVRFRHPDAWKGLFSQCSFSGHIVSFVRTYLGLLNIPDTVFVLFLSDGDIRANSVEQVLQAAQLVGANRPATVLVATLAQTSESAELRYVYMPLDDRVFRHGIRYAIPTSSLPEWGDRSDTVFYRGGQSGNSADPPPTLRYRVVEKLFSFPNSNCRIVRQWERGYERPEYFGEKVRWQEFLKYKIFLIVDGNCIASNHMWGFAAGCVPFVISRARCWFQDFIEPFVHYIPIAYDLSNLEEMITWVREHDDEARDIAQRALALSTEIFSSTFQKQYLMRSINSHAWSPRLIAHPHAATDRE